MPFAKYFYALLLLLGCALAGLVSANAQPCGESPNPPPCTFVAVDVQTGQIVEKLCVGRPVRFDLCNGRPAVEYRYQVVPGRNALPNPCGGPDSDFQPPDSLYTPSSAGPVTVTENGQAPPGGTSTIFFRVFEVYANPEPAFTATACSPGFVLVTLPDAPYDSYDSCTVQLGSSTFRPVAPGQSVIYRVPDQVPPVDSITVTGMYNDNTLCTKSATKPLPQLAALGPLVIQRLSLQGTMAQLDVAPLVDGYRYTVERADFAMPSAFQPVPTAVRNGLTGFTIPSAQPGFYRLRRTDDCQQAQAVSEPVSTLKLTVQAAERRNELTWQLGADPGSYELTRNGTPLPLIPPLSGASRAYTDTAVVCGVAYTYRLTAHFPSSVLSVSNEVPVRATATQPPPTPRLLASFDKRNRLELTATIARFPNTGQLTFLRDGRPIGGTTPARTRRDSLAVYSPAAAPCYQVRFEDNCPDLFADSAPFCPAILSAELADTRGSSVRLRWSELRGAPAPTQDTLRLLVLGPTNNVLRAIDVGAGGTYLDLLPPADQPTVRYRLEVTGAGLPAPSYSNIATVSRAIEAYVPTAFTPNGDGLNDVLEVKGRFLKTFTFAVFDRNGQEVFRGTDKTQAWDGRIRNQKPVPGAYVWRFEAKDERCGSIVQHGTVTILP